MGAARRLFSIVIGVKEQRLLGQNMAASETKEQLKKLNQTKVGGLSTKMRGCDDRNSRYPGWAFRS